MPKKPEGWVQRFFIQKYQKEQRGRDFEKIRTLQEKIYDFHEHFWLALFIRKERL